MDIQERLTAFAMLGATWVMWLLVALSVVGVMIMLERAYYMFASSDDIAKLKADLLARLRNNDLEGARARLRKSPSVEAKVALAALEASDDGPEAAEKFVEGQLALGKVGLERNLAFLGTVGNNAPFVGLLGTVIGIIRAFHELNASQGQVSAGLMSEIGEALVATAIGLLVALPAVAAFNTFQRMIKVRITRADVMGKEVLAFLKSRKRKGAASSTKVAREEEDDEDEGAEESAAASAE